MDPECTFRPNLTGGPPGSPSGSGVKRTVSSREGDGEEGAAIGFDRVEALYKAGKARQARNDQMEYDGPEHHCCYYSLYYRRTSGTAMGREGREGREGRGGGGVAYLFGIVRSYEEEKKSPTGRFANLVTARSVFAIFIFWLKVSDYNFLGCDNQKSTIVRYSVISAGGGGGCLRFLFPICRGDIYNSSIK